MRFPATRSDRDGNPGTMNDKRTTRLLIRYRRTRDPRALARVFDEVAPRLNSLALHLVRDPNEAEEAVQAVFLSVIESIEDFDESASAWPWLTGILRNRARKSWYRRRMEVLAEDETVGSAVDPAAAVATREAHVAVRRAADELPDRYREVVALALDRDFRPAEIAVELQRSPVAVRTQLHRAVRMLRDALPPGLAFPLALAVFDTRGLGAVRDAVVSEARRDAARRGLTQAAVTSTAPSGAGVIALAFVMAALGTWGVLRWKGGGREEGPLERGSGVVAELAPPEVVEEEAPPAVPEEAAVPTPLPANSERIRVGGGSTPPLADEDLAEPVPIRRATLKVGQGIDFASGAIHDDAACDLFVEGPCENWGGLVMSGLARQYDISEREHLRLDLVNVSQLFERIAAVDSPPTLDLQLSRAEKVAVPAAKHRIVSDPRSPATDLLVLDLSRSPFAAPGSLPVALVEILSRPERGRGSTLVIRYRYQERGRRLLPNQRDELPVNGIRVRGDRTPPTEEDVATRPDRSAQNEALIRLRSRLGEAVRAMGRDETAILLLPWRLVHATAPDLWREAHLLSTLDPDRPSRIPWHGERRRGADSKVWGPASLVYGLEGNDLSVWPDGALGYAIRGGSERLYAQEALHGPLDAALTVRRATLEEGRGLWIESPTGRYGLGVETLDPDGIARVVLRRREEGPPRWSGWGRGSGKRSRGRTTMVVEASPLGPPFRIFADGSFLVADEESRRRLEEFPPRVKGTLLDPTEEFIEVRLDARIRGSGRLDGRREVRLVTNGTYRKVKNSGSKLAVRDLVVRRGSSDLAFDLEPGETLDVDLTR
ncbi:MAG: sigma-70 family RNA polymerase sigma factor [Planctomycetota bacterium]